MPSSLLDVSVQPSPPDRLIRLSEVVSTVGLCRSAIYQRMAAGTFPKLVKLGRASRWHEREVQAWVRSFDSQA